MIIRNVTEADSMVLWELASKCRPLDLHTPYTYWVLCHYFSKQCFILEEEASPIGFISSVTTKDCVFVWQIGILEEYRKRKLSRLLLQAVFSFAKGEGMKLQTSISQENNASKAAFNGFCHSNNLSLYQIGELNLKTNDGTFSESETLYEISPVNNCE